MSKSSAQSASARSIYERRCRSEIIAHTRNLKLQLLHEFLESWSPVKTRLKNVIPKFGLAVAILFESVEKFFLFTLEYMFIRVC